MYAFHLDRHFLAGAGQLVQRLTLVLCGGIGRNGLFRHIQPGLHFAAGGLFKRGARSEIVFAQGRFGNHGAFGVPSVGNDAEAQRAAVGFHPAFQQIAGKFCGVAEQNEQHAGGHGVESARMTDFFLPEALHAGDGLRGAEPLGLVQYQYAVLLFHARSLCTFNYQDSPAPAKGPGRESPENSLLPAPLRRRKRNIPELLKYVLKLCPGI